MDCLVPGWIVLSNPPSPPSSGHSRLLCVGMPAHSLMEEKQEEAEGEREGSVLGLHSGTHV